MTSVQKRMFPKSDFRCPCKAQSPAVEKAKGKAQSPAVGKAKGKAQSPEVQKAKGMAQSPEVGKAKGMAQSPEVGKVKGKGKAQFRQVGKAKAQSLATQPSAIVQAEFDWTSPKADLEILPISCRRPMRDLLPNENRDSRCLLIFQTNNANILNFVDVA